MNGIIHVNNGATTYNYTWNSDGMLRTTSESDTASGGYTNSYVYDNYGQLTRENNGHFGKTILYTYDNVGNITKAQKYNYTTGAVSGTPTEDTYTYSTVYPDRLTKFNNKNIEYDDNGCVKTYDGRTYNWHKGKLSSINKSTVNSSQRIFIGGITEDYTFKYNAYGQRIKKEYTYFPGSIHQNEYLANCTSTYEYDLNGRLLSDTRKLRYSDGSTINKKFVFIYEESDIVGVVFTNSSGTGTYYYDKNPRGDVIAILDNSGNTVVKYRYDAYGNCTCYYSTNNDLEQSNPIRYRSYYYDEDTGLYYLNARYYNPQWRRFISPDSAEYIDLNTPNGLNLYAYCGNDPVNYVDPSGYFPVLTCLLGLTALVGVGLTIGGVASDNNIITAIGLTMVAIPALISGGLAAFAATGTLASGIGTGTMIAGVGTSLFASAEYQEVFTGNNWILSKLGEDWYNGLMIFTASFATLGTFASSFAYSFNINSIQKIGKVDDYCGIKFTQRANSGNLRVKTLCIHPAHNGHPIHWQLNNINPVTGGIGKKIRWDLLLRRLIGR